MQTEAFTSSHLYIHENERVIELLMYGFLSKVTELTNSFWRFDSFFNSSSLIIFSAILRMITRFVKKKNWSLLYSRTTINRTSFGREERLGSFFEQSDLDLIWPEARETKFEEETEGL